MGELNLYEIGERGHRIIDQVARNMHDEFPDYPARIWARRALKF